MSIFTPYLSTINFFSLKNFIGFFHEHTRSDRDQYITINWENVPDEFKHNFRPCTTYHEGCHDSGVGYDYDSIMHYGKRITGFIENDANINYENNDIYIFRTIFHRKIICSNFQKVQRAIKLPLRIRRLRLDSGRNLVKRTLKG